MDEEMREANIEETVESFAAEHTLPVIEWVAEQMPGGFLIYLADEKQDLLYVNTAVLRIFGCASLDEFRDLTGFTFRGLIHPDDYERVQRSIDDQLVDVTNDNLDYVEYRIVRRDGSIRWVDDYGHYAGLMGYGNVHYVFLTDVTDRHQAQEENVRRAEVIEGLSTDFVSIFLLDLESGVLLPYRGEDSLIGTFLAQLGPGTVWQQVLDAYSVKRVADQDREMVQRELSQARIRERLAEENSFAVNYHTTPEDGPVRIIQMSVTRILRENGKHAVIGFRDVTDSVLAIQRQTANKLRMELELEKERRTHEAKSEFLFNISHDIRTPMNAIMGFTALAKQHAGDPDLVRDFLQKVSESNQHMLALIDDLLEMSQIDAGRVQLRSDVCSLRDELNITLDMMDAQAEEKQLELLRQLELSDDLVCLDALRFRRIMLNLIGNAIKFTPGGGRVTVSAREGTRSDSGFCRYEIVVSDTGVGMTEEFMQRMFRSFEREESSTRSGIAGTGLGLTIVKSLVDIMGGSIEAQSEKNKGSVFTLNLPLRLARAAEAAEAENVPEPAAREPGKFRVLVVEDIEINRLLAETILEESGFLVESVPDGCDAVDAVRNHPLWYYDLILMDIQMPVMNGYEATRAIRALNREDTRHIPILALSANARTEDKRMSLESGMDSHIAKPFDVANLISTVNDHIEARGSAGV